MTNVRKYMLIFAFEFESEGTNNEINLLKRSKYTVNSYGEVQCPRQVVSTKYIIRSCMKKTRVTVN